MNPRLPDGCSLVSDYLSTTLVRRVEFEAVRMPDVKAIQAAIGQSAGKKFAWRSWKDRAEIYHLVMTWKEAEQKVEMNLVQSVVKL
jgi:hypothetical protein